MELDLWSRMLFLLLFHCSWAKLLCVTWDLKCTKADQQGNDGIFYLWLRLIFTSHLWANNIKHNLFITKKGSSYFFFHLILSSSFFDLYEHISLKVNMTLFLQYIYIYTHINTVYSIHSQGFCRFYEGEFKMLRH